MTKSRRQLVRWQLVLLAAAAGASFTACQRSDTPPLIDPTDADAVSRGRPLYAQHCASCHGAKLEGQPNWRQRRSDGRLPAPPHDETGHTWHHPDAVLFGITKEGLMPGRYAPTGYVSDMPAFSSVLSDSEIRAVLAYIKSTWPRQALDFQRQMDRQAAKPR